MIKLESILIIGVCGIALCHLGAIRKHENAILDTQTGPIKYEDKMEEIKDGVKGAPTPSMQLYPKHGFQTDPPFEKSEEGELTDEYLGVVQYGEPIPENLKAEEEEYTGFDWWQIDEPVTEKKES